MNDFGDTTVFFGRPWLLTQEPAEGRCVDPPVGQPCSVCAEPIVDGDSGFLRVMLTSVKILGAYETTEPVHAECEALGIVGHTFGVCSCTGYDTSSRASARLLWSRLASIAHGINDG